jgi:hypothetical protein
MVTGGGSPTGGGSGTDGGSGSCSPLLLGTTAFPDGGFTTLSIGYSPFAGGAFNEATYATSTRVISFELVRMTGAMVSVPYAGSFMAGTYNNCVACLQFGESCVVTPPTFTCPRRFLAQSGTVNFSEASASQTSGRFSGMVSNVTLREWNFASDTAVDGGTCYTLPAASFSGRWP